MKTQYQYKLYKEHQTNYLTVQRVSTSKSINTTMLEKKWNDGKKEKSTYTLRQKSVLKPGCPLGLRSALCLKISKDEKRKLPAIFKFIYITTQFRCRIDNIHFTLYMKQLYTGQRNPETQLITNFSKGVLNAWSI